MCSYHECSAVTPNCEKKESSVLKKFSFNKVLTRTLTFKLVLPAYKSTCHRYSLSYKTVELNSVSGSFETVILLCKEYHVILINNNLLQQFLGAFLTNVVYFPFKNTCSLKSAVVLFVIAELAHTHTCSMT